MQARRPPGCVKKAKDEITGLSVSGKATLSEPGIPSRLLGEELAIIYWIHLTPIPFRRAFRFLALSTAIHPGDSSILLPKLGQ